MSGNRCWSLSRSLEELRVPSDLMCCSEQVAAVVEIHNSFPRYSSTPPPDLIMFVDGPGSANVSFGSDKDFAYKPAEHTQLNGTFPGNLGGTGRSGWLAR